MPRQEEADPSTLEHDRPPQRDRGFEPGDPKSADKHDADDPDIEALEDHDILEELDADDLAAMDGPDA